MIGLGPWKDDLAAFVEPYYADKDVLHGIGHIVRLFRYLKPLLTGTYLRQPLSDTLAFIEENVLGTGKVYLPESEPYLREQEAFARDFHRELRETLFPEPDDTFFDRGRYPSV